MGNSNRKVVPILLGFALGTGFGFFVLAPTQSAPYPLSPRAPAPREAPVRGPDAPPASRPPEKEGPVIRSTIPATGDATSSLGPEPSSPASPVSDVRRHRCEALLTEVPDAKLKNVERLLKRLRWEARLDYAAHHLYELVGVDELDDYDFARLYAELDTDRTPAEITALYRRFKERLSPIREARSALHRAVEANYTTAELAPFDTAVTEAEAELYRSMRPYLRDSELEADGDYSIWHRYPTAR